MVSDSLENRFYYIDVEVWVNFWFLPREFENSRHLCVDVKKVVDFGTCQKIKVTHVPTSGLETPRCDKNNQLLNWKLTPPTQSFYTA